MMAHARLSPSGAHAWSRCPGKPAAEVGYPDETNPYAVEGTAAHAVAEYCLRHEIDAEQCIGREFDLGLDGTWMVDAEMARHVQTYLDNVRRLADGLPLQFVEVRVPIDHITGEEAAFGTADFIAASDEVIQVHDLKYGKGVRVEAFENEQALMYASGAVRYLEHLCDFTDDTVVEIYIHQPRLDHLPEWRLPLRELVWWERHLAQAAERCNAPDAPRIPGEVQCKFCKAKADCPALFAEVNAVVAQELPDLSAEDHSVLVQALSKLKMIRDWCAAVEARAIHLLEQGVELAGWKLVEGRSVRKWNADDDEVAKALKKCGLKTADIFEKKIISVAQAEKKLPKVVWERLQPTLVTKTEGKPTLAPESDKRPALNSAAALGLPELD